MDKGISSSCWLIREDIKSDIYINMRINKDLSGLKYMFLVIFKNKMKN